MVGAFMRRVFSIFSLLLLAVWLPATQHCALEAVGLIGDAHAAVGDFGCCENQPGSADGCAMLEGGLYKPATDTLKAPAPELVARVSDLLRQRIAREAPAVSVGVSREQLQLPRDWVVTWQFVRRAAPPARAPSVVVA